MNLKTMDQNERIDQQEWLVLQVSLHIEKLLEEKSISRTELARKLGTDKSYVTKLLDGANLTLRSIADVMMALDSSLVVDTIPIGFQSSIRPLDFTGVTPFVRCEAPRIELPSIQHASVWTTLAELKKDEKPYQCRNQKVCA